MLTTLRVDRNDRRDDRNHGPEVQLHARDIADGAGTIQVPRSILLKSEDSKGQQPQSPSSSNPTANNTPQIDKYPFHYRHLSLPPSPFPILSPLEQQYLQSHQALLSSHYQASFLSSFPQQLQKLDDAAGGISMVDKPDEESAVFCRVLRDAGSVEVQGEAVVGDVELRRGDVWVLRWSAVSEAVGRGDVEMI